jgi:hypothetical protein
LDFWDLGRANRFVDRLELRVAEAVRAVNLSSLLPRSTV